MNAFRTKHSLFVFCAFLFFTLTPVGGGAGYASGPLLVSLKTPILPIAAGITQEIEIFLDDSLADEYQVTLTSESGYGVLLFKDSPAVSGTILCKGGEPSRVPYRWSGPVPTDAPAEEVITVSIPELGVTEKAAFSVGVKLVIDDVQIDRQVPAGLPRPVYVTVRDEFHPHDPNTADALRGSDILRKLGAAPELKITLISDSPPRPSEAIADKIAARYLGGAGAASRGTAYPNEFKAGMLTIARTDGPQDGAEVRTVWTTAEGGYPEVTPPSPGEYRVAAAVKTLGATGVSTAESNPFTAEEEGGVSAGLPLFYDATLKILSASGVNAAPLAGQARDALSSGREKEAAELLGAAFKGLSGSAQIKAFGSYTGALISSGESVDGVARYLQNFLGGYTGRGVLIIDASGVKSWKTSPPGVQHVKSGKYLIIPFDTAKNFVLELEGSGTGDTALWKIVRQGTNKKTYKAGDWTKEITVFTSDAAPK
ncbi:hypothetical protein FACS1894167_07170 [Synergistales bacterium]|nr:hypothetical protein FACS1894167_07170 [Synergistales bacterium]